jgi:hypothetical protein
VETLAPEIDAASRFVFMTMDVGTYAEIGTALGTLVLAFATYAAVRSANAASRTAERTMLQNLRPLLFPSRLSDEPIKVGFADRHYLRVPGGQGIVEVTETACYLAMSLRNVGRGIGVLDGYVILQGENPSTMRPDHAPVDEFRRLTRDLYIPPGEIFFWQAAIRDTTDPLFDDVRFAARNEEALTVELLYGDEEGAQHTITRYGLIPHRGDDGQMLWLATVSRHWSLDGLTPR